MDDTPLDAIDRKLLARLQQDATTPINELAEAVNLTTTPCWRRVQRLEKEGYILKRVALLNAAKLGVGVTVFVQVKTSNHSKEWFHHFKAVVQAIPEVVEFYRMSGAYDYMLRVIVPDIVGYDRVYQRLISQIPLSDVTASFAMEQLKYTTELPLPGL